jgi:hypothetical protein
LIQEYGSSSPRNHSFSNRASKPTTPEDGSNICSRSEAGELLLRVRFHNFCLLLKCPFRRPNPVISLFARLVSTESLEQVNRGIRTSKQTRVYKRTKAAWRIWSKRWTFWGNGLHTIFWIATILAVSPSLLALTNRS